MKRLASALILAMLLLGTVASGEVRIVDNHDQDKEVPQRLNLRGAASSTGETLASFYTGAEVDVIEAATEGYVKVKAGSLEGYMSEEFLVTAEDFAERYGSEAIRGRAAEIDLIGLWTASEPMFSAPGEKSKVVAELPDGASVRALGLMGAWGYVQATTEQGEQKGFVRLLALAEPGEAKTAIVMGSEQAGGVVLRASPSAKSAEVMTVQNGTACILLFGRSGSWIRVRIGRVSGWIQNEPGESLVFLEGAPRTSVPFYPPLMQTAAESLLYEEAGSTQKAYMTLGEGMKVEVLGLRGEYAYVRTLEGGLGAFESGDFGFVLSRDLSATASSGNVGVAQADDGDLPILLYNTPDRHGRVVGALNAGAQVRIQTYTQTDFVQLSLGEMMVYAQKKGIRLLTTGNEKPSDRIPQRALLGGEVTLYAEPASGAASVGTLSAGSRVYMLAKCGNWAFVNAGAANLDVNDASADLLGFVQLDQINAPAGTTHLLAALSTDKVNMREGADRASPIIGKARLGERLRVADYGNVWTCVVKEDGTRGYIMTEYLTFE